MRAPRGGLLLSPTADELDDELRESDFELWRIPKGVARVKYQRLNKKEKIH